MLGILIDFEVKLVLNKFQTPIILGKCVLYDIFVYLAAFPQQPRSYIFLPFLCEIYNTLIHSCDKQMYMVSKDSYYFLLSEKTASIISLSYLWLVIPSLPCLFCACITLCILLYMPEPVEAPSSKLLLLTVPKRYPYLHLYFMYVLRVFQRVDIWLAACVCLYV